MSAELHETGLHETELHETGVPENGVRETGVRNPGLARAIRHHARRGFTLTELVIALIILEVMLLGAVELLRLGLQQSREAELIERIIWEVTGLVDSVEASGAGTSGERERPWGRLLWDPAAVTALDARDSVVLAIPVSGVASPSLDLPFPDPPTEDS